MQHSKRLLEIMTLLRDPQKGCPWDVEQDFASIAPYTLEEAYEVADAIARNDMSSLKEELGDLLLQVVFHAQMAQEQGLFDFEDVAEAICDKMIARHPHIFADADIPSAEAQVENWEKLKAQERQSKQYAGKEKGKGSEQEQEQTSALDDIPLALPALTRAEKLGRRAARTGFDWPDAEPVFAKIYEELEELKQAAVANKKESKDHIYEEMGDVLFACVNLARHLGVDAEEALRRCNRKFEQRFRYIERSLAAQDKTPAEASLEEMEQLWHEAKVKETG